MNPVQYHQHLPCSLYINIDAFDLRMSSSLIISSFEKSGSACEVNPLSAKTRTAFFVIDIIYLVYY